MRRTMKFCAAAPEFGRVKGMLHLAGRRTGHEFFLEWMDER
jgi:hypothetical protein